MTVDDYTGTISVEDPGQVGRQGHPNMDWTLFIVAGVGRRSCDLKDRYRLNSKKRDEPNDPGEEDL